MNAQAMLPCLGSIAEFQGTAAGVLELIDELERAGLTPDHVRARLQSACGSESHFLELAAIYERYTLRLKELGYFDQKSLARKARELLFAGKQLEYDLVLIDGFDRVSHLQAQVFAGLCRHAALTTIAFDYEPEAAQESQIVRSPFQQTSADYRWKDSSYQELLAALEPEIIDASMLQAPAGGQIPYVEAVSLLDPFLEMIEVTRQVKAALTCRNCRPEDLIVVARNPEAYSGAIEAAFEDAGIAYFIEGSTKVSDLEPWRFVRNLVTISQTGFKRKDVIDLVGSPFMNLSAAGLTETDLSLLDLLSYEYGLTGGLSAWQAFLSKDECRSFAKQLLLLFSKLEAPPERACAAIQAGRLEDLLDTYLKLSGFQNKTDAMALEFVQETERALRQCLKVLLQEEALLNSATVTFQAFVQKLNSLMEKASYARPRPQIPCLTISSAELVPGRLFKEVYICGVAEGDFPRHQAARGLLSPEQIRLWAGFGIDIRNPRQEPGFEHALFYSLCERAQERIFLSLPQFKASGEETIVSFYIDELAEKTGLDCRRISPFAQGRRQPVSVREALCGAFFDAGMPAAEALAAAQSAIDIRLTAIKQSLASFSVRSSTESRNPYNGYLVDLFAGSAEILPEANNWTASRLNDYGKCPFRYWASHILALAPRQEAEPGLSAACAGRFYHKVLEYFFLSWSKLKTDGSRPGAPPACIEDLASLAFERGLAWLAASTEFCPGPFWLQEQKDLRYRLDKFISKEIARLDSKGLFPALFELNFGNRQTDSYPALKLQSGDGPPVFVSGIIDRIDYLADGRTAQLVDYKLGSTALPPKDAERGRNLQLPVYALALEQCIKPGMYVSEADYLSVRGARSVGNFNFGSPEHAKLKSLAIRFVQDYAAAVRRGIFTVSPNGADACLNCPHASACRVAELTASLREESDAASD
jgi:ATP-dependent helicase/nuclease subunit B